MKFKEILTKIVDKAYDFADGVRNMARQHQYKLLDKEVAKLNARLKAVAPMMSAEEIIEIEDAIADIDNVNWTKSGRISKKGLTTDSIKALNELIPTKKQYREWSEQRQSYGLTMIGRVNKVNAAFENIMNMYYSDWSGKTRIRNSDISKLPKDLQEQLWRMMSNMGSEYAKGSDVNFNNISDGDWERLENYLEQYQKLM